METRLRNAYLLDFYGELITPRQQEIYHMHFCEDMSLAEIGERCKISRQGASDALKQAQKSLEDFDNALGLVSKHFQQQHQLAEISAALDKNDIRHARLVLREMMEV